MPANSGGSMLGLITLVILMAVLAGVILWFIGVYNGLVTLRNNIDRAWSNIDVLLKQRHDELPKLIDTCKGYMKHEAATFEKITELRSRVMNASNVAEKAQADNLLSGALRSLFAVAENYPELKANANFMNIQQRITGIESDIAGRRDRYNDDTNTYNIRIEVIPDVFIARLLGYSKRDLFQAAGGERTDVKVAF
jgi:LemA protein